MAKQPRITIDEIKDPLRLERALRKLIDGMEDRMAEIEALARLRPPVTPTTTTATEEKLDTALKAVTRLGTSAKLAPQLGAQILAGAGSERVPSISFSGDTDTGIFSDVNGLNSNSFFPTNGLLSLATAGQVAISVANQSIYGTRPVMIGHGDARSTWTIGSISELLTLSTSATTTNTTGYLLPGGSASCLILAVMGIVTVAVAGAATLNIGDPTTATRFMTGAGVDVGDGFIGINQWKGSVTTEAAGPTQQFDEKVRVTASAIPSAGKVRLVTFFLAFQPPLS